MGEWKGIETAPRGAYGGPDILLYGTKGQCVGYWDDEYNSFVTDYRGKGNFDYVSATHWMPLPEPPK